TDWVAALAAWLDVLDQDRPCGCAIRLPQLAAVSAVVRGEVQGPAYGGQGLRVAVIRGAAVAAWLDVPHQHRPSTRAVGLPQLGAVRAIEGREIDNAAYGEVRARAGRVGIRRRAATLRAHGSAARPARQAPWVVRSVPAAPSRPTL